MNEQKLKKLIELVDFDQAFIDLAQKVQSSEKILKNLQDQKDQLEKKLDLQTLKKHETFKQLHDQELKLKELQAQEAHLSEISGSITTSKEFDAAHKEVEKIKFARNQEEQKMMQLSNKVEAVQKEYLVFLEQYEKTELMIDPLKEQSMIDLQTKIQNNEGPFYLSASEVSQNDLKTPLNIYRPKGF